MVKLADTPPCLGGAEHLIKNNFIPKDRLEIRILPLQPHKLIIKTMKIKRFPSGAVRSDDTGRIRPDYISPYALNEIAQHFTDAKNDFGATNYFKGIKPQDVLASIQRHYLDLHISMIEDNTEVIRLELRALAANCIMGLHQIVLEERGLYKEPFEKNEIIDKLDYSYPIASYFDKILPTPSNGTVSESFVCTTTVTQKKDVPFTLTNNQVFEKKQKIK